MSTNCREVRSGSLFKFSKISTISPIRYYIAVFISSSSQVLLSQTLPEWDSVPWSSYNVGVKARKLVPDYILKKPVIQIPTNMQFSTLFTMVPARLWLKVVENSVKKTFNWSIDDCFWCNCLWKGNFKNDDQQLHKYQQSEQPPLI